MARSANQDLTQGKPLKLLAAFVVPMLIGNVVQQLYSMADSIIIGRFVGKGPFAAIGATMPVLNIMIKWLLYKDHMGAVRDDFQG